MSNWPEQSEPNVALSIPELVDVQLLIKDKIEVEKRAKKVFEAVEEKALADNCSLIIERYKKLLHKMERPQ